MKLDTTYYKIAEGSGFEAVTASSGDVVLWTVYPPKGSQKEIDKIHFNHIRDRKIVQGPIFDDLPEIVQKELSSGYPYADVGSVGESLTHVNGDFRTFLRESGLDKEDEDIGKKGLKRAIQAQAKYGDKVSQGDRNESTKTV